MARIWRGGLERARDGTHAVWNVLATAAVRARSALPAALLATPPHASPAVSGRLLDRIRTLLGAGPAWLSAPSDAPGIGPAPPLQCARAAVEELDARVSRLILSPIPQRVPDLDERILHQWCAVNRRWLFGRTPYLFAYEWFVAVHANKHSVCQFQGDLVLWDGASSFLTLECKMIKPRHPSKVERLRQVGAQASLAAEMLNPFLFSRRRARRNPTFSSAQFLQTHDAFRMSHARLSSARMPELVIPSGVIAHIDRVQVQRVDGVFMTNLLAEHGALPGGLLADVAPLDAARLAARCQQSLDDFCANALVVTPTALDARLQRLARKRTGEQSTAARAQQPNVPCALLDGACESPQPDDAPPPLPVPPSSMPLPLPQLAEGALLASADELRGELSRRAVQALRESKDGRLTLSRLAAKVLPESVSFRELNVRLGAGVQPGDKVPPTKRLGFKDFLLSEEPFEIVEEEEVMLKSAFKEGSCEC